MPSKTSDSSLPERTSLSLLQRAKSDDQQAWQKIVQLYGPLVYSWLRRTGMKEEDVADVFQDSFRAVAQGLQNFTPNDRIGSFRAWLKTVTRSKVANHFKRARRHPTAAGGTEANMRIAEAPDPLDDDSDQEVQSDEAMLVRRAMELIEPDFNKNTWQAFQGVTIEGREVRELAEQLDMTEQAVRQAIYRIRRRLKHELEGLLDWPELP